MSEPAGGLPFWLDSGDGIQILPVCHYRAEFADEARRAVHALRPRVVAVELPASLEAAVERGLRRLPELSVVVYPGRDGASFYLPIEPTDPTVEALRSARDIGAATALVDLDVEGYADYRDPLPDPFALRRIGLRAYYEAFLAAPRESDPHDARREAAMAYHLQRLRRKHGTPVLLVCGMAHAEGALAALEAPQAIPFGRPRRADAAVFNLAPQTLGEVLTEPPFLSAVYECLRAGVPRVEEVPLERFGRSVGPFRILDGAAEDPQHALESAVRRAAALTGTPLDRQRLQLALLDLAVEQWERRTGERLASWQREAFARFSRNLAHTSGLLVADLYDFLLAVRGAGDENLLWEAHRLATSYPWQRQQSDLATARISGEDLWLGTRRLRIRPRVSRAKSRPLPRLRRRPHERYPGEWLEGFDEEGYCSYPPEDLVLEEHGRYLRCKGRALLAEEHASVEPFRTSLLDGIDMRETLRHWATERCIYVRRTGRTPGAVGAVVVIFDPDPEDERHPFRMTWLGEHDEESDMAFYSTDPTQGIVGPGICRCRYGGFLMSWPPRRLYDVWADPDYRAARDKAEVLLLAALDYSLEPLVVHVAARPPRSWLRTLAERLGRTLVHVPLGQLAPASRERMRTFHILAGRGKREIASDYIW